MQKSAHMTYGVCGFRDGFNHFRVIFRSASAVFVVSDMELIDNLCNVLPNVLMVTWQWKRLPGYLQVVQMTHIVITQNDVSPVLSLKVAECGDKPGEHKQEDLCRTLRSAIEG